MPSKYTLIKTAVPIYHSFDSGLVWDPVDPYVFIPSTVGSRSIGNGNTFMYRYNRDSRTLDLVQQVINVNSPYGSPAVDKDGRLYYSPPGGLTFVSQHSGAFRTSSLEFLGEAEQKTGSSSCTRVTTVSGTYFLDQYIASPYWWHITGSDLFNGSVTCFYKNQFCRVVDPNSEIPLKAYSVPQTAFQSPGGFFSTGYKFRAACADDRGILYVYLAGPDATSVTRYWLWRVRPSGVVEFIADLKPVISQFTFGASAVDGRMRWFRDDDSLILSTGRLYLKVSPHTGAVSRTLYLPPVTPLHQPQTAGVWLSGTNQTSFHNSNPRTKSIWIADYRINGSVPVPAQSNSYFPMFTEIKMADLTRGRILVSYEIAADYPPVPAHLNYRFLAPNNALFDIDTGEFWCDFNNRSWVGVFTFTEVPPEPPPDPTFPVEKVEFCLPKNRNLNTTTSRLLSSGNSSTSIDAATVNTKNL